MRETQAGEQGRRKLTVIIPTLNEEENLVACLESVRWADEVFVVDSFSTDGTLEIARKAGTRVEQHEYIRPSCQKNWAISRATHRWVLCLDADERVPPELAREIQELLSGSPDCAAYRIKRVTYFLGRKVFGGLLHREQVTRLFDRTLARYQDREVHEELEVDGPIGRFRTPMEHYTAESVSKFWKKQERYSDWAARDSFRSGRRTSLGEIALRSAWRFLRTFFLEGGFLGGRKGLLLCGLLSAYVFLKYAKLWGLWLEANRKDGGPGGFGGIQGA